MAARAALFVALAAAPIGCSDIRLKTVDTQERVISTHQRITPAAEVKTRARVDGTLLLLEAEQACQLAAVQQVEVVEDRVADEDLIEEFILLGVAAVPLVSGIVILADAPNVHGDDRNARLYNPVGKDGAYTAGTVLTSLGGLIALLPIIELVRIASAGETTREVVTRQGEVIDSDRPCEGAPRPVRTSVVLRVGGVSLATPGTDRDGLLRLDLAEAIPPDLARRAVVIEVVVGGEVVVEVDPRPILEAQQARAAQIATEPPAAEVSAPEGEPPEGEPPEGEPPEGEPPPTEDDDPPNDQRPAPQSAAPPPKGGTVPCRKACLDSCRAEQEPRAVGVDELAKAVIACTNRCIEERCE